MHTTLTTILAEAEALANLRVEHPIEADFQEAEAEVRAHYERTSEPFFTEDEFVLNREGIESVVRNHVERLR